MKNWDIAFLQEFYMPLITVFHKGEGDVFFLHQELALTLCFQNHFLQKKNQKRFLGILKNIVQHGLPFPTCLFFKMGKDMNPCLTTKSLKMNFRLK
ncbi:MAG: hypothetical protein AUJ21_07220 [Anaerolineae bacterium CG1_02_58_13]|nr:MAG: hypothetical protein AUJ21_07220 [Anaerolineae bacterium CG1_02_58_13]